MSQETLEKAVTHPGSGRPPYEHNADSPMRDSVAAALERKRMELETGLAQLTDSPGDGCDISFGKRVGDWTTVAVERLSQVSSYDRLQALLTDVRRAQAKLADGSYGSCDRCGADIPRERLEALPWAVLCVTCAARR